MVNRSVILIFFLGLSFTCLAQKHPVIFGEFEYYRNTGFKDDAFYNVGLGAQIFQWKFLAPEIGFETYSGSPDEINLNYIGEPNSIPEAKLKSRFSSYLFTIAPKLKFGNEEASLVIIPQFNTGKLKARGDYLVYNGNLYALEERQKSSASQSFWSIAAGVEGQFINVDHLWFSVYLKYSMIDSESVLDKLDFSEEDIQSVGGSADGLGLGIRVYYDLISALR